MARHVRNTMQTKQPIKFFEKKISKNIVGRKMIKEESIYPKIILFNHLQNISQWLF